jgi:Ca2+-binding RTX toxin-like protein
MSLISGFNVTASEVATLAHASLAAFRGGAIPSGWTVVTPAELNLPAQFRDGVYFTNNGASAIVLERGDEWIVAFRGTDSNADLARYPQLLSGTYINNFQPLLAAVAAEAPAGTHLSFTGASLGGAATNELADIAAATGRFSSAHFVAFASPVVTNANGILNVGFENDPIYKALEGYGNHASSLDNIVLATPEYMAGNYDGRHPFDTYAHVAAVGVDALERIEASAFFSIMNPDSVVIVDASPGLVRDITPGRATTGAFYIGQPVSDVIAGRSGPDHIEGFAGNDQLYGGGGTDILYGGTGDDLLNGETGADIMRGGPGNDTYVVNSTGDRVDELHGLGGGRDAVASSVTFDLAGVAVQGSVERLSLQGAGNVNGFGNALDNSISGNSGANQLVGRSGDDILNGRLGNDTMVGGPGSDTFLFATPPNSTSNRDTIRDFNPADDTIMLAKAVFTGIGGLGTLAAAQFVADTTGVAHDANDHIIYDTDSGRLIYDSNGSAAGNAVVFALLDPNLGLTNSDFFIV